MSEFKQENGKRTTWSGSGLGLLLIGLGGLLLLSNMGIIGGFGGIIGLLVLGGMGAWLLNYHYTVKRQSWMLFLGFILMGCAAATVTGDLAGAWFLGISGIGFLQAWREDERQWWALIPAGTFFSLAGVVVAEQSLNWLNGGTVLFAGFAVTFLVLYMLPRHAQPWALIPAVGSAVLALIIWGSTGTWILPLILIGVGLYLIGNRSGASIPRGFNYDRGGGSGQRRASGEGRHETAAPEPAQLPEEISSTGPSIPERWTEQDGENGSRGS